MLKPHGHWNGPDMGMNRGADRIEHDGDGGPRVRGEEPAASTCRSQKTGREPAGG